MFIYAIFTFRFDIGGQHTVLRNGKGEELHVGVGNGSARKAKPCNKRAQGKEKRLIKGAIGNVICWCGCLERKCNL